MGPNGPYPNGDSDALFAAEVHSFLRGKLSADRPRFVTSRGFESEARYSHSPPLEIAKFPLRLQSACVRHFVTGGSRDTSAEPPLEA
jgi:hypothetical protein